MYGTLAHALQHLATTAMSFPEQAISTIQQPAPAVPSAQQATPALVVQPPPVQPAAVQREAPTWQTSSQTPQPPPTLDEPQPLNLPLATFANSVSRSPAPPAAAPVPASTPAAPPSAPVSLPQAPSSAPHILAPQSQYLPISAYDASQLDSNSQRKRGRPRKYFDEESKRAAELERRRKKRKSDADGDESTDDVDSEANGTSGAGKKEERRPYLHYQMDFGKYDNTKPGALTARDVVVNWLAAGTNFKDWLSWSMDKKNEVAQMLRKELKEHGMLDRDIISVKQQITYLMRGCEEAKKFENEKVNEPLTTFNSTKVSYLTNRGIAPGHAYLEHTWPFYPKLKDAVADVSVPMPVTRPPRSPRPVLPPQAHQPRPSQMSSSFIPSSHLDSSMDYSALDGNLDPALGGAMSGEPLQAEVLAVTSWANHLLSEESRRRQTSSKFTLPDMEDAEMVKVLREKEKWELEKMQIRQKLELEKEQMKIKDKTSERETHVQSILVFRDLLKDGLTKNEAGRIVWRDQWPAIKASMDADDD